MSAIENADQIEFWNSPAGEKWIRFEERLDGGLGAVKERLLERANVTAGEHVVDIGCGTGATTLELAGMAGGGGSVLAVDVSRPLLERAAARAASAGLANVSFKLADAQTHAFSPSSADLVVSRFGVMFFADPVAAFANIVRVLKPGGRVSFVSWASLDANPWFKIPRDAAIARLGQPAPTDPDAPGPLAFRDISRVAGILQDAGLSDVRGSEELVNLKFPGTLEDAADLASNLGPASRIAKEKGASLEDIAAIASAVAEQIADMVVADGVSIPARLNFFSAVKS